MGKFKEWFFKGRIEKSIAKEEGLKVLSKEYDDGKILKIEN